MSTYDGFVDRYGFAKHLLDFTRKLDESVLRMKAVDKMEAI